MCIQCLYSLPLSEYLSSPPDCPMSTEPFNTRSVFDKIHTKNPWRNIKTPWN